VQRLDRQPRDGETARFQIPRSERPGRRKYALFDTYVAPRARFPQRTFTQAR